MKVHLNKKYHNFKVFFTKWKMTSSFQHNGRRPSLFNTMVDNLKFSTNGKKTWIFQQHLRWAQLFNKTEDNLNFSITWVTTSTFTKIWRQSHFDLQNGRQTQSPFWSELAQLSLVFLCHLYFNFILWNQNWCHVLR